MVMKKLVATLILAGTIALMAATFALPDKVAAQPEVGSAKAGVGTGPLLIDSPGVYTLRDLGYSDVYLEEGGGTTRQRPEALYRYSPSVEFLLPSGAAQGHDLWYVLHFHFEIELQEDTGDGRVVVLTEVNDNPPAMIDFSVNRLNGAPRMSWNTTGMVDGLQEGTTDSLGMEMRFSNFMPNGAIRPGKGVMEWAVAEHDGARFAKLHIFDDTSIEVTPLSPAELSIAPNVEQWRPPANLNETFEVPYRISNVGGWPAKEVVTEVSYPEDSISLLGDQSVTVPALGGGEEVSGSFQFGASAVGAHDISLLVHGTTGGTDKVVVTVTISDAVAVSRVRFWLLVMLVVGLSALPVLPFRRIVTFCRRHRQGE